jgi:hypothetical protein
VEVMRFKMGDKVRVREKKDLRQATRTMDKRREQYAGEVLTITGILGSNYITEETEVWWKEEMLEPIEDPLVKKIEERNNKPVKMILDENLLNDNDPIKPSHYRKGEIDLYESWYRTYPFNEFRAIMSAIAERYMKRDKDNRIQDLDKAIYTLSRLKEYEVKEHAKN